MRNHHSFSLDFITRKLKTDKTKAMIFARVTLNGERREISLRERIEASDWWSAKEIVRGKSIQVKTTNELIEQTRFNLRRKYRALLEEGKEFNVEDIKQAHLGVEMAFIKKSGGHRLFELIEYYERIWKDKLKPGGFKNYKTTFDYVKRFSKSHFSHINPLLSELTMQTATEFETLCSALASQRPRSVSRKRRCQAHSTI